MKSETVEFSQVAAIGQRYFWLVVLLILASAAVSVGVSFQLPERFKSSSTLSIQSSYFKNPLVNDLISEEYDHNELRARREALLRMALGDQFLNELAQRFELFPEDLDPNEQAVELELLRQRIEFFSLNPNTYQVSVTGVNKQEIFEMNSLILDQMIQVLLEQRISVLTQTKDAIEGHVEELGATLKEVVASEGRESPESIRSELQNVRADLQALLLHYSEQHPDVFILQRKADSLQNLLNAVEAGNSSASESGIQKYLGAESKRPIEDVFNELLQKLSYLKIVLEIESSGSTGAHVSVVEQPSLPTSPFFPNKKMFLLFGIIVGVLLSIALIAYRELRRLQIVSAEELGQELGLPYLGSLPTLDQTRLLPLLDGPRAETGRRALSWVPLKGR